MSQALQRVVVRMLHDPAFAARVYESEIPEVSPVELAWIRATDRRAWGTDPHRRARVIHALVEEFPVSTAARGWDGWESFFRSEGFHRAVQQREALVEAYAEWLGTQFAALERAVARSRRSVRSGCLGPGVVPVQVQEDTVAAWVAGKEQLGVEPVAAILAGVRLAQPSGPPAWILVTPGAEGPTIADIGDGLGELLRLASTASNLAEVRAAARSLGAEEALVDELVEEGLLADQGSPGAHPTLR